MDIKKFFINNWVYISGVIAIVGGYLGLFFQWRSFRNEKSKRLSENGELKLKITYSKIEELPKTRIENEYLKYRVKSLLNNTATLKKRNIIKVDFEIISGQDILENNTSLYTNSKPIHSSQIPLLCLGPQVVGEIEIIGLCKVDSNSSVPSKVSYKLTVITADEEEIIKYGAVEFRI